MQPCSTTDIEVITRLAHIHERLAVMEQLLLRLYALMQQYIQLRNQ